MPNEIMDPMSEMTVKDIVLTVMIDGYRYGVNDSGPWRWIKYLAKEGEGPAACDALKGVGLYTGTTGGVGADGPSITFNDPHKYRGNEKLVCVEADGEETGYLGAHESGAQGTEGAIITAKYAVPRVDIFGTDHQNSFGGESRPWINCENRGYVEEHPVVDADFQFTDPNELAIPQGGAVCRVPVIDKIYTRFSVPFLYDELLEDYMGCVNLVPFWNRARGLILFDSFSTRREVGTDGNTQQEYQMVFKRRKYPWNAQLVPGTARTWKEVKIKGEFIYEQKDLWDVIRYGTGGT